MPLLSYLDCIGDHVTKLRARAVNDHTVFGPSVAQLENDPILRANFDKLVAMTQDCLEWTTMADGRRAIPTGADMQSCLGGAQAITLRALREKNPYCWSTSPQFLSDNIVRLWELGMPDSPCRTRAQLVRRIQLHMEANKGDVALRTSAADVYDHEPWLKMRNVVVAGPPGMPAVMQTQQEPIGVLADVFQPCVSARTDPLVAESGVPHLAYTDLFYTCGDLYMRDSRVRPVGPLAQTLYTLRSDLLKHTLPAMAARLGTPDPTAIDMIHSWLASHPLPEDYLDDCGMAAPINARITRLCDIVQFHKGGKEREAVLESRFQCILEHGPFPRLRSWLVRPGSGAWALYTWILGAVQHTPKPDSVLSITVAEDFAVAQNNISSMANFASASSYEVVKEALRRHENAEAAGKETINKDTSESHDSVTQAVRPRFSKEDSQRIYTMVASCSLFQRHRDRIYHMLQTVVQQLQATRAGGMAAVPPGAIIQLATDASILDFNLRDDPYIMQRLLRELLATPSSSSPHYAAMLAQFGTDTPQGRVLLNHPVFIQQLHTGGKLHTEKHSPIFALAARAHKSLDSYFFLSSVYGYNMGLSGTDLVDDRYQVHHGSFPNNFVQNWLKGNWRSIHWFNDFYLPIMRAYFEGSFPDYTEKRLYADMQHMDNMKPYFLNLCAATNLPTHGDHSPEMLFNQVCQMTLESNPFNGSTLKQMHKHINFVFTESIGLAGEEFAEVSTSPNVEERFSSRFLSSQSVSLNAFIRELDEARQQLRTMMRTFPHAAKFLCGGVLVPPPPLPACIA